MSTYTYMYNHHEEKLVITSDEDDDDDNPLSMFWGEDLSMRKPAYDHICDRSDGYIDHYRSGDPDDWFGWMPFDDELHERLGIALRPLELELKWEPVYNNELHVYHCAQFNKFLARIDNVLSRHLKNLATAAHKRDAAVMLQGAFSDVKVCDLLKYVLEEMFCTRVVDESKLDLCLDDPARYSNANMLLTCFTIAGDDTNACWVIESPYDCFLCHIFRTVLFHLLSFMKQFMRKQKYYVNDNLELQNIQSPGGT